MSTDPGQATRELEVEVPAREVTLVGTLTVPPAARGVVVFAHGSGSGRFSPRNRAVAGVLVDAGLATLLMDLLTAEEEAEDIRTARLRFDIRLLAERVISAIDWLTAEAAGRRASGRLLWGQHRRGGCADSGGRAPRARGCRGLSRRSARPRGRRAAARHRADAADRGRPWTPR